MLQKKFLSLIASYVLLAALGWLLVACGSTGPAETQSGATSEAETTEQPINDPGSNDTEADRETTEEKSLAPLPNPVKVKIAEDGAASGAGFYIADAKGYFQELRLDVEFVSFSDSSVMLPALASNQVQVAGGIVTVSLLNAFARDINIKIFGDKGHNVPGKSYYDIVVRKELADLESPADLKGRKVAFASRGSADEYFTAMFLKAGGLTLDDVEVVEIGDFAQMTVALSTGAIDAAAHIEPFIAQGESEGILDRWIDLGEVHPESQNALMLASPEFTEDIEVSGRFMVAYLKAVRDYNDAFFKGVNKDEIIEIMTQYTPLKDKDLWQRTNVAGLDPNGKLNDSDLRAQAEYFRENGYFSGEFSFDDLIDLEPAKFALEYLGDYE